MKFPFKLTENKQFDAVGFGTNAVDYLIVVPEYPEYNSKIELTNYHQLAGGEIASTMVGLSRLGMKSCYVGRFGDDSAGDFGLQTLRSDGVNIDFAEQIPGATTQIAFIVIDERTGERTVIWKRDSKLAYRVDELQTETAKMGKILHVTPHDTLACKEMAKIAREHGAIISMDIDKVFDGIDELLPLVDIFVSSREFPEKLVGIADKYESLREIKRRYGCGIVGLTRGIKGALILCEDQFIESDGYDVPNGCKDTTGAGDAFRVGFLYGLLKNESVEMATKMANAVGALKCREIGARTALPNETEIKQLINGQI